MMLVKKRGLQNSFSRQKHLILMLLPILLHIFLFRYVPLVGWIISVKDYQLGMSIFSGQWLGLLNFKYFLVDTGDALYVIRNTLVINFLSIFFSIGMALVFSLLLNEIRVMKFKSFIQTSSIFPFFISWVVIYSIFNSLLSVNFGLVNQLLIKWGVLEEGINFLGDKNYSWPLMIGVNTWRTLGYNGVIFLAAIASIDQEQYQAAEVDGAGRFAKMMYITLPGLASTFVVLLIIHSGWVFTVSLEQYFLFTNSTNRPTMEVFDYYIFRYGLQALDFGYATAVGVIKTVVSIFVFLCVNFLSKKVSGRSLI
jgi:putative aldouronate transport system permease protein